MDYFEVCQRMRAEDVSNEERLRVLKMCISQGVDVSQLLYDTYDALTSNHEALKMLASVSNREVWNVEKIGETCDVESLKILIASGIKALSVEFSPRVWKCQDPHLLEVMIASDLVSPRTSDDTFEDEQLIARLLCRGHVEMQTTQLLRDYNVYVKGLGRLLMVIYGANQMLANDGYQETGLSDDFVSVVIWNKRISIPTLSQIALRTVRQHTILDSINSLKNQILEYSIKINSK